MKAFVASCVLGVLLVSVGCAPPAAEPVDLAAAAADARAAVDQFPVALETEDVALMSRLMAHDADMVCFGTDASERWVGWDALKASVELQFAAFENTKITVRDQVVKVGPSGDVAWFTEVMDWDLTAGGEPVKLEGARISGVLEKRDGAWVMVQFHTSLPVAGQAAEY